VNQGVATQVVVTGTLLPLTNIVEVGGGTAHTCARDTVGGVWCWGFNNKGQLGDGTKVARGTASKVLVAAAGAAFGGAQSLMVSEHVCARKADDTLWCWGENLYGAIGQGNLLEVLVPTQAFIAPAADTGRWHTCAVKIDGSAWCWGESFRGTLGNGADVMNAPQGGPPVSSPVQVVTSPGGTGLTGVADLALGSSSCALLDTTEAMCWGGNNYGQTGTGSGSSVPMSVLASDGTPLSGIDRLVADFTRVCAFMKDGRLLCWGKNVEGQLGDGTQVNRGVPTEVSLSCP